MERILREASAILRCLDGREPVLYGSFALEKVIGPVFPTHDIDLLVSRNLLERPQLVIKGFSEAGFRFVPAEVLSFEKNGVLVELADWTRWNQRCGFHWERTILENHEDGSYRRLDPTDLDGLYRWLQNDPERSAEKRVRDQEKTRALRIQSLAFKQPQSELILPWLLEGDPSVRYWTRRHLLGESEKVTDSLHRLISTEGWAATLLSRQNPDGHWGISFYQPKWTSTHYTLTDLKDLGCDFTCLPCVERVEWILRELAIQGGGINWALSKVADDLCVDGMILAYGSRFVPHHPGLGELAKHLLSYQKADGGFSWDEKSLTGDPHTTLCVLEGFSAFRKTMSTVWNPDFSRSEDRAIEFIFAHRLFQQEDPRFSRLAFPRRYRYDLLRFLEYYALDERPWDERLRPGIEWLKRKQRPDGKWELDLSHPGKVHMEWEKVHQPSRLITQRALLVLSRLDQ